MASKTAVFLEKLDLARSRACPHCGHIGKPGRHIRGSLGVEIAVWLVALLIAPFSVGISLVAALGYSIWRLGGRYEICGSCGTERPVKLDTPRGRELLKQHGGQSAA